MSRRGLMLEQVAWLQGRQAQVGIDASQGYLQTTAAGLLVDGPRSLEVYFRFEHSDTSQFPASYSVSMLGIELYPAGYISGHIGNISIDTPVLEMGKDYHVILSWDGSIGRLFVDGVLIGERTPASYTVASNFRIGHPTYSPVGPVHFVRVYDYGVTASVAAMLYNDGEFFKHVWHSSESQISAIRFLPNFVGSGSTEGVYTDNANGFTGRYCRIIPGVDADGVYHISVYSSVIFITIPKGRVCKVKFRYRSSAPFVSTNNVYKVFPANRGDAQEVEFLLSTISNNDAGMSDVRGFVFSINNSTSVCTADDWLEIQPISVETVLPAYVLPSYAREMDKSVELAAPTSWLLYGDTTYDSATGEFHIVSDGTYSALVLVDTKGARLSRTDCIYQLRFKAKGSGGFIVTDGGSYRPEFPLNTITATDDYVEHVVLLSFPEANSIAFKRLSTLDVYIKDVEVTIVGCVAEYLPQNLVVTDMGLVSSWLDSAGEFSSTGEYISPLRESIGGYDLNPNEGVRVVYVHSQDWYGIEFDVTESSPSCVRIGDMELHRSLPIQSRLRGCLLDDAGNVVEYLNSDDWTSAVRDGSRGQVMVELPAHYRKFETDGTKRRVCISEYPLSGYHFVGRRYVSAYEATLQRSSMTLCSVVNMDVDYRGGNNNAAWDDSPRTLLGRPATAISRIDFRNYARKRKSDSSEWNCMVYDIHKELYWLFVVEYATLNSQAAFNTQKDSDGYSQGGLGAGVSTLTSPEWDAFNSYYPFVPCGHTDSLGNYSGEVSYDVMGEDGAVLKTVMVPRYRGVENPFGHVWKWTDGINLRISPSEEDGGDGLSRVFVCADPSLFSDSSYDGYTYVGDEVRTDGYVQEVLFGDGGDIVPSIVGGDSVTYFCDYHYAVIPTSEAMRGVHFGGDGSLGAYDGFTFMSTSHAPLGAEAYIGSRLCFIPAKN